MPKLVLAICRKAGESSVYFDENAFFALPMQHRPTFFAPRGVTEISERKISKILMYAPFLVHIMLYNIVQDGFAYDRAHKARARIYK